MRRASPNSSVRLRPSESSDGGWPTETAFNGQPKRSVLIRAVGETVAKFRVQNRIDNPTLSLWQGSQIILRNDDWSDAPNASAISAAAATVGAFALSEGSLDAAMLVTLMPGSYTVQAVGIGGTTGDVLVEVYEVP